MGPAWSGPEWGPAAGQRMSTFDAFNDDDSDVSSGDDETATPKVHTEPEQDAPEHATVPAVPAPREQAEWRASERGTDVLRMQKLRERQLALERRREERLAAEADKRMAEESGDDTAPSSDSEAKLRQERRRLECERARTLELRRAAEQKLELARSGHSHDSSASPADDDDELDDLDDLSVPEVNPYCVCARVRPGGGLWGCQNGKKIVSMIFFEAACGKPQGPMQSDGARCPDL